MIFHEVLAVPHAERRPSVFPFAHVPVVETPAYQPCSKSGTLPLPGKRDPRHGLAVEGLPIRAMSVATSLERILPTANDPVTDSFWQVVDHGPSSLEKAVDRLGKGLSTSVSADHLRYRS